MNDLQIKYFLTLSEQKNFTNTAKVLYVSQPAISKQIASLEKELGFSLFFRSNRNVSLTPAGLVFLKAFTQMNETFNDAVKQTQDIYSQKSKRLRLGCVDGLELGNTLNKIFNSFHEHFPNVEYQLEKHSPNNLMKALFSDNLDAIITIESFIENDSNLSSSVLLRTKHLLYVSANNPILKRDSYSISDFNDETFIVLSPEVIPQPKDKFFEWCNENGLSPKNVKTVPNVESQTLSVEVGLGITIADEVNKLHSNPLLKSIELNTYHNICIVWKKDSTNLLIPSFAKLANQINSPIHNE